MHRVWLIYRRTNGPRVSSDSWPLRVHSHWTGKLDYLGIYWKLKIWYCHCQNTVDFMWCLSTLLITFIHSRFCVGARVLCVFFPLLPVSKLVHVFYFLFLLSLLKFLHVMQLKISLPYKHDFYCGQSSSIRMHRVQIERFDITVKRTKL